MELLIEAFLESGSVRKPRPIGSDSEKGDIEDVRVISNRELTADEIGNIKREHWSVGNRLFHVLDKSFREGRSPAKNNMALNRKLALNILRIAMLSKFCGEIVTEAMDTFCDNSPLMEKYVFSGISSFY